MSQRKVSHTVVNYYTHKNFRSKLRQLKQYDTSARVMGLDIGRKFTGIALSDRELTKADSFKTLREYDTMSDKVSFYQAMQNIIRSKHVRGIVVGYPLNEDGQGTRHCKFIEEFLDALAARKVFRSVPVTLVNEYNSTMMAKL